MEIDDRASVSVASSGTQLSELPAWGASMDRDSAARGGGGVFSWMSMREDRSRTKHHSFSRRVRPRSSPREAPQQPALHNDNVRLLQQKLRHICAWLTATSVKDAPQVEAGHHFECAITSGAPDSWPITQHAP